jgi:hypothetical protein
MEFAIHGYMHVDHSQLSPEVQLEHVGRALSIFEKNGITCQGFRSPYLQWNSGTLDAIKSHGLDYESNQPILWDVLDGQLIEPAARAAYRRVIDFYSVKSAWQYLSLPRLENGLVHIPVALPDDEMLIERLRFHDARQIEAAWRSILQQTYERGELFTLSLHPERTAECQQALAGVLADARGRQPAIWIAQLRQVADWWRRKQATQVQVHNLGEGRFHLEFQGPEQLTVLVRGFQVEVSVQPWFDNYSRVMEAQLTLKSSNSPFIGVSPDTPANLVVFLRQLGYLVEINPQRSGYGLYLEQKMFSEVDEKPLIDHIEGSGVPLIRLGFWPAGARSALAITGDIDALTLWDFGLRLLGA